MANIPAAHMRQFTPENLDDIETVVVETDLLIICLLYTSDAADE